MPLTLHRPGPHRARLRLGMRLAAGMRPHEAARAESLPGAALDALLAQPSFARLVEDYRDLARLGREERLARLELLAFDVLEDAIAAGDTRRLVAVPGIGKKKADLMVLQLRDKVKLLQQSRAASPSAPRVGGDAAEAVSALVNLGYKQQEAERAVARAEQAGAGALAELIREALRRLAS